MTLEQPLIISTYHKKSKAHTISAKDPDTKMIHPITVTPPTMKTSVNQTAREVKGEKVVFKSKW